MAWLGSAVLLTPFIVPVIGAVASSRLTRRRWMVHLSVLATLMLAPFAAINLEGAMDPTSILYPGPGDGLLFLLYIPEMLFATLIYAVICFVIWRGGKVKNEGS